MTTTRHCVIKYYFRVWRDALADLHTCRCHDATKTYPRNTSCAVNAVLILGQSRRRWPRIKPTLFQRISRLLCKYLSVITLVLMKCLVLMLHVFEDGLANAISRFK